VFEAFQAMKKPAALNELAVLINAPLSSCHGIVRTLRNRGYLYSIGTRSRLYPTKRLLEMASEIAIHDPILDRLGPLLLALRDESGETVILGKRQKSEAVYLDVVPGLHAIRYAASPGRIIPLHASAIGKAVLGEMEAKKRRAFIEALPREKVTGRTVTDVEALIAEIDESRRQGYFVTRGENVADVMAIAVGIRAASDWLAVAIAGPLARVEANFERYLECLRRTAARASA
jgi:DNA-binding IclR family transcriptional regulator